MLTKKDILALLAEYDANKSLRKKLLGGEADTTGIKAIKKFMNTPIDQDEATLLMALTDAETRELIALLKTRYDRIRHSIDNYRSAPDKETNKLYTKLAHLLSNDPIVLAFVQAYENDYSAKGVAIHDYTSAIFITENRYIFQLIDLEEHLRLTESLSYPIPGSIAKKTLALTEHDITELKKLPSIADTITRIEEKFSHYVNQTTLVGEWIVGYPKSNCFYSEDHYCFLIDELFAILKNQNKLYNPYTKSPFSDNDLSRLLTYPSIKNLKDKRELNNVYLESKISADTRLHLKKLALGLLNKNEIQHGLYYSVPISQKAYETFNHYYQDLSVGEQKALNDFWIDAWDTVVVYYIDGVITGLGPVKFGDLYEQMNQSCIHSIAGSLIKMVLQLNPDSTFEIDSFAANRLINSIRANAQEHFVPPTLDRSHGLRL